MGIQEFNNYKFSINTEVKHKGEWHKLTEVDFALKTVILLNSFLVHIDGMEDIRN